MDTIDLQIKQYIVLAEEIAEQKELAKHQKAELELLSVAIQEGAETRRQNSEKTPAR